MDSHPHNGLLSPPMIMLSRFVHRNAAPILVAWVALAALFPSGSLRPLYLFATYFMLPAVLLLLLLRIPTEGVPAFRPGVVDLAMMLFTVLAVISIVVWRNSPAAMMEQFKAFWRAFLGPFVLFWIVRISRPGERQLTSCFPVLVGLCLIEIVVGVFGIFYPKALPDLWPSFVNETGGIRITGTLVQPDSYAAILIFSSSLCFHFFTTRADRVFRILGCGLLVLGFSAVFANFSRASWLGGILVLGAMACHYRRTLLAPVVLICIAVTGIFHIPAGTAGVRTGPSSTGDILNAAAVPGASETEGSYAIKRLVTGGSVSDRITLSVAGLNAFLQRPLFGWGMGSYDQRARKLVRQIGPFVPSDWALTVGASHNSHISILAELGIAGYACFAVPLICIFAQSIRALRRRSIDGFLVVLWANLLFLALVSFLIDMRFLSCISGLAGILLGLTAVRLEINDEHA